jgi:outer membrane immunogenic protein
MTCIASFAVAAFWGVPALAADMPVKAPPLVPPPIYSWTRCYLGVNNGGAWANKSNLYSGDSVGGVFTPDNLPLGDAHPSGWVYGGQLGCDYQFASTWVVGIRGMWDGANVRGSNVEPPSPNVTQNYTISSFGSVVGKVGYLLNPMLELYALGGVAWVNDKLVGIANGEPFDSSQWTRTGYDIGIGLSWIFAPNWDAFIEYDYMGFGTKAIALAGFGPSAGFTYYQSIGQSMNEVLVGIDYRFAVK